MSPNGCWYSHRRRLIYAVTSKTGAQLGNMLGHELSHFFLHASTPYGQIQDELEFTRQKLAIEIPSVYDGLLYFPLYDFVSAYLHDPELYGGRVGEGFETVIELTRLWSQVHFLDMLFEGQDGEAVREHTVASATDLANKVELVLCWFTRALTEPTFPLTRHDRFKVIPGELNPERTASLVMGDNSPRVVGAAHIHECYAYLREDTEFWTDLTEANEETYLTLLGDVVRIYLTRLLERASKEATAMSELRQFKSYAWAMRMKWTSLALSDLAMFVPYGNVYGRLRHRDLSWSEIHPVWRFARALSIVDQKQLWIENSADVEGLQNSVCDALGWVRPREFLKIGTKLAHSWFATHRAACEVRLSQYDRLFHVAQEGDVGASLFYAHAPMIYCPTLREGGPRHTLIRANDGQSVILHFLSCFTDQFMRGPRIAPDATLPPHANYSQIFQNIHSNEDMITWLLANVAKVNLARFCPFTVSHQA
jgi:hypothetical protein